MKASRTVIVVWLAVIAALIVVEVAELTGGFTLPLQSAIANPIGFVTALIFTTILALVGAIFIGLYVAQRWMRSPGFTPFEEEMLKMRKELQELREEVARQRGSGGGSPPSGGPP